MFFVSCRIVCLRSHKLGIVSRNHTTHFGEINTNKISIRDFYRGKSVFLTGGSGFIGKAFIEKFLNIEGVGNIYLLMREKKGVKIEHRVQELFNNELFSKIRQTKPELLKKIVPVAGDVGLPNLGISDEDEKNLREKVSVVIHSAATVRFYEQLSVSMNINYEGTKRILELCKRINNLAAFVHISTAFVNVNRKVVDEVVYPPRRSIQEVTEFIQKGYTQHTLQEFYNSTGNTYTFTKSMAEDYVKENHGDIPTAIIRPSVVTSKAKPPEVGWCDNWSGFSRIAYNVAQGYARVVPGDGTNIVSMIPIDYCINLILAAAVQCPRTKKLTVYHACSSSINPVTAGDIYEGFRKETIRSGQNALPYPMYFYAKSDTSIRVLAFLLQTVPAYVADYFLKVAGKPPKWVKLNKLVISYREALKLNSKMEWIYIARNLSDLHEELTSEEQQLFPVSPHDVDWKTYIPTYSQGIRKYLTY